MPEELPDNSEDSEDKTEPTAPLEVKITNNKKTPEWNDSKDDSEYEDIILTDEDMNI